MLEKTFTLFFSPEITHLVNISISQGSFPDELKIATVALIFKSFHPQMFSNYQPVSVLLVITNIFEKVLHQRIVKFFEKHDIFISTYLD